MDPVNTPAPSDLAALPELPPAMPREAPLAMPAQVLKDYPTEARRKLLAPQLWRTPSLIRLLVFGGMALLTGWGAYEIYKVVEVGGVTPLEWLFLLLFIANFSWIALAFMAGIVGFLYLLPRGINQIPPLPEHLTSRTAVVMPIYNESPARVFGTMQAIIEDVNATGLGAAFDFFLLSDTTDANIWIAEEKAFLALREALPGTNVYYRHRARNTARKAGNIADFVTRWGGNYQQMLVLDADSVMTGPCIVALAAAMENDPDAGIIQTLPRLINRNTLIARMQQFAGRIYGPVVAAGLSVWSGRSGNYWGHNAIIRMQAFAECAGLPDLPGKPPFGGHILSHDFVEAAFIRRGGWAVYMLPTLEGSYEESPPSLMDLAIRDRRWCQGNLQHSRVMFADGLHMATRQHFATGIASYVASPLWLAQIIIGLMLALQAAFIRPEYFTREFSLFPAWPVFDAERALNLFIITMAVLLTPKMLGWLMSMIDGPTRRGSGGIIRLTLSVLIEIILSALLAPVMMVIQSGSVFSILFGRDTGWKPQRRDDGTIPIADIIHRHWRHMLLGLVGAAGAFAISEYIFYWMSPTIIGLVLAVPLSAASGSAAIGWGLRNLGLLVIPEESRPPEVAERAKQHAAHFETLNFENQKAIDAVHGDEAFRIAHEQIVPALPNRKRGTIDPDRAVAIAKLDDARTLAEAKSWLSAKETMIVLHDRKLVKKLAALPLELPPKD